MADKKADEAPPQPAPPMSEAEAHESDRANVKAAAEAEKATPKADAEPPKTPNAAGHFAAPKKD